MAVNEIACPQLGAWREILINSSSLTSLPETASTHLLHKVSN